MLSLLRFYIPYIYIGLYNIITFVYTLSGTRGIYFFPSKVLPHKPSLSSIFKAREKSWKCSVSKFTSLLSPFSFRFDTIEIPASAGRVIYFLPRLLRRRRPKTTSENALALGRIFIPPIPWRLFSLSLFLIFMPSIVNDAIVFTYAVL